MRHRNHRAGISLAEALLAIFLAGATMGMLGLLFQRSFSVLRLIDDKERARQAGRMGLDRMTSELREAVRMETVGDTLEFEKIDPNAVIVAPAPAPTAVPEDYEPPEWTPNDAYPDARRLLVRYSTDNNALFRQVKVKSSGAYVRQTVVEGVNAFRCAQNPENPGEVEVTLTVQDNQRMLTLSSRVICPCIKEEFQ